MPSDEYWSPAPDGPFVVWGASVDEDLEGAILDAVRAQVPAWRGAPSSSSPQPCPACRPRASVSDRFESEAAERIEAIIEVCARGPIGDEPVLEDLAGIGADAARAGVPLPGVLVALRTTHRTSSSRPRSRSPSSEAATGGSRSPSS